MHSGREVALRARKHALSPPVWLLPHLIQTPPCPFFSLFRVTNPHLPLPCPLSFLPRSFLLSHLPPQAYLQTFGLISLRRSLRFFFRTERYLSPPPFPSLCLHFLPHSASPLFANSLPSSLIIFFSFPFSFLLCLTSLFFPSSFLWCGYYNYFIKPFMPYLFNPALTHSMLCFFTFLLFLVILP